MSTMQIYLGTGVDVLRAAIKYAIGDNIEPEKELISKYQKGVAIRYWFPKPGRIVKINGQERIEKKSWVKLFQFNLQKGDIIEPPTDLTKRFGFVICEGRTRLEAVRRAEKALSLVTITCV